MKGVMDKGGGYSIPPSNIYIHVTEIGAMLKIHEIWVTLFQDGANSYKMLFCSRLVYLLFKCHSVEIYNKFQENCKTNSLLHLYNTN